MLEQSGTRDVYRLEMADFDADGDLDILTAHFNRLLIFENLGDGQFSDYILVSDNYDWLAEGRDFRIHDINQDGRPDVIAGDYSGVFFWYPNMDGSFPVEIPLPDETFEDAWVRDILFIDIDEDGEEDIVQVDGSQTFYWFRRLGPASFAAKAPLSVPVQQSTFPNYETADLDNDGDQDLVMVSYYPPRVQRYINTGNGVFSSQIIATYSRNIVGFDLADVDSDGDIDIVTGNFVSLALGYQVVWHVNDGSGIFSSSVLGYTATDPNAIRIADLDADGDQDILTCGHSDSRIHLFEATEPGVFEEVRSLSDAIQSADDFQVSDMNGDGLADILLASYEDDRLCWLPQTGSLQFDSVVRITRSTRQGDLSAADWNDDGLSDLLIPYASEDYIAWYPGRGQGAFEEKRILAEAEEPIKAEWHDLDADGQLDLIYLYKGNTSIAWRRGEGNGLLGDENIIVPVGLFYYDWYDYISYNEDRWIMDMDGDGDPDILLNSGRMAPFEALRYMRNDGNGVFTEVVTTGYDTSLESFLLHASDLDGDALPDLVMYRQEYVDTTDRHLLGWYRNEGNGAYSELNVLYDVPSLASPTYWCGDFNEDGTVDIIAVDAFDPFNVEGRLYLNDGEGTFEHSVVDIDPGEWIRIITVEDIDGDGDKDLLQEIFNQNYGWTELNSDLVSVGNYDIPSGVTPDFNNFIDNILLVDLDGDGDGDILYSDLHYTIWWIENQIGQDQIKGRVFGDSLANCLYDSVEYRLQSVAVRAEGEGQVIYDMTSDLGEFRIYAPDPGTYRISVEPPNNLYAQPCFADSVLEVSDSSNIWVDFPLSIQQYCPQLSVDLFVNFLRLCAQATYVVSYCNSGTADAEEVYIEIELDEYLRMTEIPGFMYATGLDSLHWRADLGSVPRGSCGQFTFKVKVSCESELGQFHCVEAHIYPDGYCYWPAQPGVTWDSSKVVVDAQCSGDSILFRIANEGSGDMESALNYHVVEATEIILQGTFDLDAGEEMRFGQPASAVTYSIRADQAPGYPGLNPPSAFKDGCAGNYTPSTAANFLNPDPDPFTAQDCRMNIGSYDPNDKQVVPPGYGDDHFVESSTVRRYTIRFQNTGTDTAFRVVIVDTLSEWLDPLTISGLTASHPYTADLSGSGILTFTFDNILLPDSSTDQSGSNGFVSFSIGPFPDLEEGSVIENAAAIYFDYNDPVITNIVFQTIGSDFIASQVVFVPDRYNGSPLTAYPNPSEGVVNLVWPGDGKISQVRVTIADLSGKVILDQLLPSRKDRVQVDAGQLTEGVYVLSLFSDAGTWIGSGKIIIGR